MEYFVEDKYCGNCGAELSVEKGKNFDKQTGHQIPFRICRKCVPCDHDELIVNGFLERWFGATYTCRNCGKKIEEHEVHY